MTTSSVGKRFGLIDDEQRRAMSGLEFVQGLVDGTLPLNTMAQTLGYDIIEAAKGRVVVAAEPRAEYRNPAGARKTIEDTRHVTLRFSPRPSTSPEYRRGSGKRDDTVRI